MKKLLSILLSGVALSLSAQTTLPNLIIGKSSSSLYSDYPTIQNPLTGNNGYFLAISHDLTSIADLEMNTHFGSFSNNVDHYQTNNDFYLNYQTKYTRLGLNINFYPLERRKFAPFIAFGAGVLHFSPKTDLQNNNGNYHIGPNGELIDGNGQPTETDNLYETDLEALELDGTPYSKFTFSSPFTFGAELEISASIRLQTKLSYTLHFTDYIDNIPDNSMRGGIEIVEGNDHELSFGIALKINPNALRLHLPKKKTEGITYSETDQQLVIGKGSIPNSQTFAVTQHYQQVSIISDSNLIYTDEQAYYDGVDFNALDTESKSDLDGDGVSDEDDLCPNTPKSFTKKNALHSYKSKVEVDDRGCPLDSDNDGVPDFRDIEVDTRVGFAVNSEGKRIGAKEAERYLSNTTVNRSYAQEYQKRFPINFEYLEKYFVFISPEIEQEIIQLQKDILVHQINNNEQEGQQAFNSLSIFSMRKDSTINYLDKILGLEKEYTRITMELKALRSLLQSSYTHLTLPEIETEELVIDEIMGIENLDYYDVYLHRIIKLIELRNNESKLLENVGKVTED